MRSQGVRFIVRYMFEITPMGAVLPSYDMETMIDDADNTEEMRMWMYISLGLCAPRGITRHALGGGPPAARQRLQARQQESRKPPLPPTKACIGQAWHRGREGRLRDHDEASRSSAWPDRSSAAVASPPLLIVVCVGSTIWFALLEGVEMAQNGLISYFTNLWNVMDWSNFALFGMVYFTLQRTLELNERDKGGENCIARICTEFGFYDMWQVRGCVRWWWCWFLQPCGWPVVRAGPLR